MIRRDWDRALDRHAHRLAVVTGFPRAVRDENAPNPLCGIVRFNACVVFADLPDSAAVPPHIRLELDFGDQLHPEFMGLPDGPTFVQKFMNHDPNYEAIAGLSGAPAVALVEGGPYLLGVFFEGRLGAKRGFVLPWDYVESAYLASSV